MLSKIILFITTIFFLSSCGNSNNNIKTYSSKNILTFTKTQRLIADQFISIFENGTTKLRYDYIEDIGDHRGYTAGRAGFTSATGDMLMVIKRYKEKKKENLLNQYIPKLQELSDIYAENGFTLSPELEDTTKLEGLKEAWKQSAMDPLFRDAQDEIVDQLYYNPSVKSANQLGLKYPLSLLIVYDTFIQHGKTGFDEIVKLTKDKMDNKIPKDGVDELTWIKNFILIRKDILNNKDVWNGSINRVIELQYLIDKKNFQLKPFRLETENSKDDKPFYLPVLDQ